MTETSTLEKPAKISLVGKTRAELERLQRDITAEIGRKTEKERKVALKAAEAACAKFGFTLADVLNTKKPTPTKKKTRRAAKIKYKHPTTGQTWTGQGRTPHWFLDAEKAGVSREEMAKEATAS